MLQDLSKFNLKFYPTKKGQTMTSIRYAIRQNSNNSLPQFIPVSREIAEGDTDNGMLAVFTTTGEQASPWVGAYNPSLEEDLAKLKPLPPINDMFGTPLNIGDYAVSAFNSRNSRLSLFRVVGFTKTQVRGIHLGWNEVVSRNGNLLVRVHDSVIAPESVL
jgi:hypothetical protein